ncbi:hypothetical protein CHH69_02400 [Terribacillus saccharophilus]|nr:hypothetical protein CHH69_02400 [Terribacillus saccharophilus]
MKSVRNRLGTEKEVRKPVEQVLLLAGIHCLQRSFWFLELDHEKRKKPFRNGGIREGARSGRFNPRRDLSLIPQFLVFGARHIGIFRANLRILY